ncbi:putative survival motor neuron (SMN) interacting protein 1 (SIP1) [Lyophyllum shimeji]|uniref:Survival motor neuron (SMN) interacting protein 1 (SIP1) n=1 Tax=Lyophyllum shimeji TaxID=47721 RepID=A0A9P3PDJ8_LYOSH|nr:putative survival motor neuron (SMN) interacting protein 1 (SIP1) [Lyophyllum shimeji]
MSSYKRKRDEFEDGEDEEPSFGRQILPIADLPHDFDGEPMDGMQYLFTVRRDARQLPHVTRASNPYEVEEPQAVPSERVIPKHPSLPSEEWRSLFETRFKNFRKNVNQPTIDVPFTPQNASRRLMPDKKERDLWWSFLAGKPESDWNPPKQPKKTAAQRRLASLFPAEAPDAPTERKRQESWQTNDQGEVKLASQVDLSESLSTPTGSPTLADIGEAGPSTATSSSSTIVYKPREPMPSLLRRIDERMALHLLMYFTHWINLHLQRPDPSSRPIEAHARWIFALLSKVEDHISADDMNLLRNLARACIALLKELLQTGTPHPESEESTFTDSDGGYMSVRSCWIIVSTVAGVWAQRDLWMDAEDMLKSLGPSAQV